MSKPLLDKDNSPAAPSQAAGEAVSETKQVDAKPPEPSVSDSDKNNPSPLVTRKDYEERLPGYDKAGAWNSTPQGRFAIRTVTRGVLGVGAFALAGKYAGKSLAKYDANVPLFSQGNPLRFVAKALDNVIGSSIKSVVKAVTGSEEAAVNAVHFRSTNSNWITPDGIAGRPYGAEVTNVTFDFFMMSVMDRLGRTGFDAIDPHIKKSWYNDKGNIDAGKALKAAGKEFWTAVSYSGGEDWYTGLTYVYALRGIKAAINSKSPGFKFDSDHLMNGGGFKLNDKNQVIGNYAREGALDFQARFMWYNGFIPAPLPVGTLQFRELYDYIGNKIEGKQDSLYGGPEGEEARKHKGLLGNLGDIAKWSMRGTVKSLFTMTPTVPFFWAFRTFGSKDPAKFIHPVRGLVEAAEVVGAQPFDAYAKNYHALDTGFNSLGKGTSWGRRQIMPLANWANKQPWAESLRKNLDVTHMSDLTDSFVKGFGYLPYMYMKGEAAGGGFDFGNGLKIGGWDNGKMDMAAERLIDGAVAFDWKEFKAGASEVWYAARHKSMEDPAREAEAQYRIETDSSPPDIFNAEDRRTTFDKEGSKAQGLDWRERIISQQKPQPDVTRADKYKNHKTVSQAATLAEREEMRKVLEKIQPPTNAIN